MYPQKQTRRSHRASRRRDFFGFLRLTSCKGMETLICSVNSETNSYSIEMKINFIVLVVYIFFMWKARAIPKHPPLSQVQVEQRTIITSDLGWLKDTRHTHNVYRMCIKSWNLMKPDGKQNLSQLAMRCKIQWKALQDHCERKLAGSFLGGNRRPHDETVFVFF